MSILCYHSVTCGWDDPVSVEPDDFEAHCAVLRSTRTVVPLAAVKGRLAAGHKLPARTAVLTFDDGFADFAEWAVPIMQRYGLPAAMYIVAGSVTEAGVPVNWITGTDASDAPPLLTTEQICELHRQGWEIGSHSMAHRDLPTLTESECLADLKESKELLSDLLGDHVDTLAYPFGHHAVHVRRAAERAGYTLALALPEGPEEPGPFAVPRTGVYRGNERWKFFVKLQPWYAPARRLVAAHR